MDPNQTAGTTPSRVNDIDPIGSDSGTEVTPTGLTHYMKYRFRNHFFLLAFSSRWRFWSQLLTVSNRRLLSFAVAVSSSPSRSFTVTKPLRLALPSSLGSRSGEEKASILSNEQPEFEDGFNENAEDLAPTMLELWNLMDTPIEEQQEYQHITCNIAASEHEITQANSLSEDFIQYVEAEVVRLDEVENFL
uniref:Uncharacterized protein n=1 Tax=Brassica oleracea var. oleracea TaxID=109376 RepID=A0A0D3EAW4_BRAOL